ncbi:bifunctional metallophosphatase/5'-nucleotidase (plasmid) [Rhizobium leguminosarum]|uniref:bifunctional metallophosphatase/5'-nucleotidase n=1 Tax=Rhizobium leguminosarum TaxID=384 RepID=UPI00103101B1|nr:bifunctional UDP-sugar hydrolase/5'-nucleotidase [Rhizobium leguminosarum]TAX48131.1 bifunctional metallophosphatase/5'-nucleotidase [Rhizobium leguminosarum]TAX86669.1 bifunctional metallophosphatase/5'-nucleotidase [Rhizobium leguminosarum]
MTHENLTRREFAAVSAAAGAAIVIGAAPASAQEKTMHATFTILHTNDIHSNLIGVGPASDYTPATLNDDRTVGGIERIATLIAERRRANEPNGPVLVLDIGDVSIGTAFGGATQETGAELQCLTFAGYDATTFGNHDFDFGPAGLASAVKAARNGVGAPMILAANTNFEAADETLDGLKELGRAGAIRSHVIVDRGGIRFGLFGIMGTDSIQFTINPGALTFPDPIETARSTARQLRAEGADVIICMSHGGVREPKDGPITEGDDISLARAVPEIDVIVGGHTHTFMRTPVIVNGTPVVQAGCYGQAVGELVIRMEGRDRKVLSYDLHPVDDTILGDPRLIEKMADFTAETSRIVFEPRGFSLAEPMMVIGCDWANTFFDLEASRPLGNLTADAIRYATKADVALNAAGMVRAGLPKGKSGVQTAYDLFLLAPLGIGVADQSAGGSLVVAYLTGHEIKNCLEFLLPGNPNLPGQYFPRVSGMRFRYDLSRPQFDAVTQIELGDLDRGYHAIDLSKASNKLYGVACNLYLGIILASIPTKTNGVLSLAPKKKDGKPLKSRADALPAVQSGPYLLPPIGMIDKNEVVHDGNSNSLESKEWEAIMNYVKSLPKKDAQGITVLDMDERIRENRSINMLS